MEVTKTNFKELLPVIFAAIEKASFLAIDAEFSGLNTGKQIHVFDTIEQRYFKLIKAAKDYIILQFGLSAFQYIEETDKYEVSSFNFYICPRQFGTSGPDIRFNCQSSSIDFLACHELDFTKVFRDGISYMLPADHEKCQQSLSAKHSQMNTRLSASTGNLQPAADRIPVPKEHQLFIDGVIHQVESFTTTTQGSELKFLDLEPCSSYHRKLIYQELRHRFGAQIHLQLVSRNASQRLIRVSFAQTEEERNQLQKGLQADELHELDDALGFSKVIEMISKSDKLVIGHNMILDVLHMVEHFLYPLPEFYDEFKTLLHMLFPRILDTKHMAASEPFKDIISTTILSDMLKQLEKPPFHRPQVEFASEFTRYIASEHLHEAGYDSYITGLCYISMSHYLASKQKPVVKYLDPCSKVIENYCNRLHLMRMTDVTFINLTGPDAKLSREHVFHLTFRAEWKTENITRLFSQFGNVHIAWLDNTSALVGLQNRDKKNDVLKKLLNASDDSYRILTYKQFADRLDNEQFPHIPAESISTSNSSTHKVPSKPLAMSTNSTVSSQTSANPTVSCVVSSTVKNVNDLPALPDSTKTPMSRGVKRQLPEISADGPLSAKKACNSPLSLNADQLPRVIDKAQAVSTLVAEKYFEEPDF